MSRKKRNKKAYAEENELPYGMHGSSNEISNELEQSNVIPMAVRQAWLQGCILAIKKNGGLDESTTAFIESLGRDVLGMSADEIKGGCDVVSNLTDADERDFVEEMLTIIKESDYGFNVFLYHIELSTLQGKQGKASPSAYKFIYHCVDKLIPEKKDVWRVEVYNSLSAEDDRTNWVRCCENAAVTNHHDALFALARFYEAGICGQDEKERADKAEELFRSSAQYGNQTAKEVLVPYDERREKMEREKWESDKEKLKVAGIVVGVIAFFSIMGGCISSCYRAKKQRIDTAAQEILANMVKIPGRRFKMGKTEITQAQWYGITGERPSAFKGDSRPVESVSWKDCQKFIEKLNNTDPVAKQNVCFRLPTEEQWEYACRAGATGDVGLGADGTQGNLDQMAWYNHRTSTSSVAWKKPNAFGLYDMHGNVFEWCEEEGGFLWHGHVVKGGAFDTGAKECGASFHDTRHWSEANVGLRLVCPD